MRGGWDEGQEVGEERGNRIGVKQSCHLSFLSRSMPTHLPMRQPPG